MSEAAQDGRRLRSDRRRRQILDAATEIVSTLGMSHLSHREVAARAGSSLGLIRYHFDTVDKLAVAVLEDLETQRHAAAMEALASASAAATDDEAAALLLHTYYGADTSRASLVSMLGWLLDAARQPVLAGFLRDQRPRIDEDLVAVLAALGRSRIRVALLRQVIDGAVVAAAAEGIEDTRANVIAAISAAMDLIIEGTS